MILVIDALNKHRFGGILDEMYKLRARVFRDRMGWDVMVRNGREIDLFDQLDPAYIVALDGSYNVVGCNRMLQTTGPHMLSDVFQDILCGEPPLRSATVWENTRFCIDSERLKRPGADRTVSYAACELMAGIAEYAFNSGISDVISVVDPAMDRILKRCDNAPYGYIGKTVQMGKTKALAALSDITEERIARIRAFAGITGEIFLEDDVVADALAESTPVTMPVALRDYCDAQIAGACTDSEREAALALQRELAGMYRSQPSCDA
ncbi:acyl homoserine lactone synthase [Roseovarius halotolerans]|uniref:Acyl-homoserine-lactone synthase n=1 Tax=Roseovarius halotolerans TaxID=505353 RepID=A0A1X6YHA6_9RHOB|nr:acyl-homoserine-lactone synthase [Roseovarius halotolerans]RKT34594.1 acyl homoserine lactone synthase [Roseovarius halotolerans]SLN21650.1 Acyl-homoserine-lactone synthase [Roseovarius halotolerans]